MAKEYLGFLPEKDDKYLIDLPKIMCFAGEGMKCAIPIATEYLNSRTYMKGRATVRAKFIIRSDVNFHDFALWFNNEVNRGSFWFHTELLFFGIIDIFKVRFITNIEEQMTDGVRYGTVAIEIDNFYNKLIDPNVHYILYCDDLTSCSEILECI